MAGIALSALVACAALVAGCAGLPTAGATPEPRICGGIPDHMGGCAPGQPVFGGRSCDAIAAEWGPAVERLVGSVFGQPRVVDGEMRSVRIRDAMLVASIRAQQRIEVVGLVGECSSEAFLARAEPTFSAGFREAIADHLYDGEPVGTWDQFMTELRSHAGVFDAASTESPAPGA